MHILQFSHISQINCSEKVAQLFYTKQSILHPKGAMHQTSIGREIAYPIQIIKNMDEREHNNSKLYSANKAR